MTNPAEMLKKVQRVWSKIEAPPVDDMRSLRLGSGAAVVKAFTGVRPVDVDIDSPGFQAATPLLDLPGRAAAAYLGPYMISLLDGLDIQEKVGFPTDISTRAHTLSVMMAPHFWTDIAGPNLPPDCLEVVGEVAAMVVSYRDALALSDEHVERFERLVRTVRRELGSK